MDGLILPDVPFEEKEEFDHVCKMHGIDFISLIAPTSKERICNIAKRPPDLFTASHLLELRECVQRLQQIFRAWLNWLKKINKIPCAVGFGISTEEQAKKMAGFSDGVIVGSAIVKLCRQYKEKCVPYVKEYVKKMKESL